MNKASLMSVPRGLDQQEGDEHLDGLVAQDDPARSASPNGRRASSTTVSSASTGTTSTAGPSWSTSRCSSARTEDVLQSAPERWVTPGVLRFDLHVVVEVLVVEVLIFVVGLSEHPRVAESEARELD
jgi:hypothetical protein